MGAWREIVQVMVDAISLGSLYALAALGIGLIFGILRLINFAHGDLMTIGGYALIVPSAAAVATAFIADWPTPALVLAVVAIVVVFALATEAAVFRPLRNAHPAVLLIGSFAVSFFLQNLVLMIYTSRGKTVNLWPGLSDAIEIAGVRTAAIEFVTIGVTAALLGGLALFMQRTRYGVHMRAAAENFRMARLLGVRANVVISIAFAASGLLAAVVALLLVARQGYLFYRMGTPIVIFAFVATIIGGMGSLTGAALGGFVLGILSVVLQVVLPDDIKAARDAFAFAIVVLLLLVRPEGLIAGRVAPERV
ncbi:MAG: branched-chain amino acid ABC transporter permease [Alphaproteobacteria bacterium]|nr:branched-chain amino acid ABC transporter permease [Alphaproteobacteria bacterium]